MGTPRAAASASCARAAKSVASAFSASEGVSTGR
jgi:hypothetical protein